MLPRRNQHPLRDEQIAYCERAWSVLKAAGPAVPLDVSRARQRATFTGYSETHRRVFLGANAYPEIGAVDANSRLSALSCLAHEYAHAERHLMGFERPHQLPDVLLDEAETSVHASFYPVLGWADREDLIEDARDRLIQWLAAARADRAAPGGEDEG